MEFECLKFLNPATWIESLLKCITSMLKLALLNLYDLSFFILIILCMYYVIQAMCGSNKGKIGIASMVTIFAIIEMIKTMILGF